MVWAKRDGIYPPPDFWADFLANVDALFPGASLDHEVLRDLYALVVDEWRNGRQVNLIVRQLCACGDGNTIEPSEGAKRRLEKKCGLARAPEGAEPGEVFEIDELREAGVLGKLKAKLALVDARLGNPKARPGMRERYLHERAGIVQSIQEARAKAYWSAKPAQDIYEIPPDLGPIRSWRIEVLAGGGWAGNAMRYSTPEAAETAGKDLLSRWTAAQDVRVAPSSDLPNDEAAKSAKASKSSKPAKTPKPPKQPSQPKQPTKSLPPPTQPEQVKSPSPDPSLGLDDDIADDLIATLAKRARE